MLLGLGSKRQFGYDSVGRVTTQIELNSSNNPIVTISDSYDAVGNRIGRNKDGDVTTWTYDDVNRLTGQQLNGAAATFAYDSVGNITVKHHQGESPMTFAYDAADRMVTMIQGSAVTTFTYDDNGNLTEEAKSGLGVQRTTYVYDNENRLTVVKTPGGVGLPGLSTYTYDGQGLRRSAHESGGSLTTYIWDGDDYLMEKS